jgi:DNA-binding NtrC family response regulator
MGLTQIVGRSAWTRSLRENFLRVARFPSGVLISGPSGTGKELVARAIHWHSPRASHPFVPVDCTSLSGELFASHLFGHVKGAFTGADYERIGCFRAAEGGTVLMDEIGELSPDLQAKLLRTIQERVVVPVGSDRPIPVDVRIVAATNRDLAEEVRSGRFRLDLFYRLNVVALATVALRERADDIEPLAVHFLNKMAVEHGYPLKQLSSAAIAALKAYSWPGNVRQLQNALERAVVFAAGDTIDADSLPREIDPFLHQAASGAVPSRDSADEALWPTLTDMEREHIRATLARTGHNQSAAANLLNINRATLARKISEYQLSIPAARRGRPRTTAI